ncbi:hypothetical protein QBC35DRAFT_447547 [Podospora australis]|uniref:Hpc2-related domain-containing protein n=1 Tax=Podospora australis TaxID=1536484 RepID=A0AAN6X251_9PEZI|nr:hypothetical protein QBC35DRAFT_447547 [Podospora australis]
MQQHYSSSPSLSSPPSALSEPNSPTRVINAGRANMEMDEIIVDPNSAPRFGIMQQQVQQQQATEYPPDVRLTAAGVPRKKPGRKPGSTVKPKIAADGTVEPPKQRRPRKPKDPNAPPVSRKRKAAVTEGSEATTSEMDARAASGPPQPPPETQFPQRKITELTPMRMSLDQPAQAGFVQSAAPKRQSTGSMSFLLNDDPPPKPVRQMFDPIRGNYDPIREATSTPVHRDPYGTGPLGSPRAPTSQAANGASASPSIASLVDPQPTGLVSPRPAPSYATNTSQPRFQETNSVPASPSNPVRSTPLAMPKPQLVEARRAPPPPPAPTSVSKPEAKASPLARVTSIANGSSGAPAQTPVPVPTIPVQSKKIAAVVQQEQKASKKARSSNSSSPKINTAKESALPPLPGNERSILDFGKAKPGEELNAPTISIHVPIMPGETNKYVNFMRMAEERYGWDALHPRLAASRERKALIAAATAALEKEKNGSGRESGEEMEEDLQSDADNSNVEMGGMNNGNIASGHEAAPAKPVRKKRNFKEDEYDKDDDFVDDSEMLWEEQAAASRDGFFVYCGPLIPEVEKPVTPEGPAKRGRGGGRGRGSRGGRGGGESGRGRGGGPGSRGGTVRKPRITKQQKEERDREKAEREKLAQMASKAGSTTTPTATAPTSGLAMPPVGAGASAPSLA